MIKISEGKVDLDLGQNNEDMSKLETKLSPHMKLKVHNPNLMEGTDPPIVKVAVFNEKDEFKSETYVKSENAIIVLNDGSMIPAKMERREGALGIIRKKRPSWKPADPPSHDKDLSYDPHKLLPKGSSCQTISCPFNTSQQ